MAHNAKKDAAESAESGQKPAISIFSEPSLDPRKGKKRPSRKLVKPWVRAARASLPSEIVSAYG